MPQSSRIQGVFDLAAYGYRKAAEQGHVNGQGALADKYERGLAVAQDIEQAARWYRGAARQGDAWAQVWLAEIQAKSRGVLEDHVKAYAWLNLATAHSGPVVQVKAGRLMDMLGKQMTAEQLAKSQKLAAELRKRIESSQSEQPAPTSKVHLCQPKAQPQTKLRIAGGGRPALGTAESGGGETAGHSSQTGHGRHAWRVRITKNLRFAAPAACHFTRRTRAPRLRVDARLTCPPTSCRVQWIPFQKEGYNEGTAAG